MEEDKKSRRLIESSDPKWLEKALECYRDKHPFMFKDDAGLGIRKQDLVSAVLLIKRVKETGAITWREICQILTGLGMNAIGIGLILIAVFDPEPTSKLGILLAGGVILILTGSVSLLRTFGQKWRVFGKRGSTTIGVEPQ
jgi:hypothetical protein